MANSMQHPFDPETAQLIKNKARRLSRKPCFTASDQDDIEQELCFHLWRQTSKFDPSIASWLKWASFILDKRGVSLLRQYTAGQRSRRREQCSLNEAVSDADGRTVDRHQVTPEAARDFRWLIDLRIDVDRLQQRLSDDACLLLRGLVDGSFAAIAREQGWSRSTMSRHLRELRDACDESDLRDYL